MHAGFLAVFVGMRLHRAPDRPTWAVAAVGLLPAGPDAGGLADYFADQPGQARGGIADLSIAGAHGALPGGKGWAAGRVVLDAVGSPGVAVVGCRVRRRK